MSLKKYVWGLLFSCLFSIAYPQNSLVPQKITVFKDGAQVSLRGILRFYEQRAKVRTDFDLLPEGIEVSKAGDFEVSYIRFTKDTLKVEEKVGDWMDVLLANQNNNVTVVFQIGPETDEVAGDIRMLNEETGMFAIRNANGHDFFLNVDQVGQIVVNGRTRLSLQQDQYEDVIEVKIDQTMPFAPVEFTGLVKGFSWEPSCKVVTVGEKEARYEFGAVVSNDAASLQDVELELKGSHLFNDVPHSEQVHDIFKMGTVSLQKGESMLAKLSDTKHTIERVYFARIGWEGPGTARRQGPFPVLDALQFKPPVSPSASCGQISIFDQDYNLLARFSTKEEGSRITHMELGSNPGIKVFYSELEKKKSSRPTKIGEVSFDKFSMEGRIVIVNSKSEAAGLTVTREIFGEFTKIVGGKEEKGPKANFKEVSWNVKLRAGQTREINYEYDALVESAE